MPGQELHWIFKGLACLGEGFSKRFQNLRQTGHKMAALFMAHWVAVGLAAASLLVRRFAEPDSGMVDGMRVHGYTVVTRDFRGRTGRPLPQELPDVGPQRPTERRFNPGQGRPRHTIERRSAA